MHLIDPQSLPVVKGTVAQLVMNRDGELDGLLFATAAGEIKLVHFPPHLGNEVENAIKVGEPIIVHGVKPRGLLVIAAVSLVTANGATIVDHGPDTPRAESASAGNEAVHHDTEAAGRVRLSLYGPKGELRGAVLEDGSVIRIGKKDAASFEAILQPGATLAARGSAILCRHGTTLDAEMLGADRLKLVKQMKEDKLRKSKKHDGEALADA